MGRTTSEIPGWYIKFQAALLEQAPRPGEISQEECKSWCKKQGDLKNVLMASLCAGVQADHFELIQTVEVIVPDNYIHNTHLSSFKKQHEKLFCYYNENITDKNFGKATTKLTPGRKFQVKIFRQTVSGSTTSEERMDFLQRQGAVFTGAQGASLVFEQKRDELPRDFAYVSFDGKKALWKDSDGYHRVPSLYRHSDGDWDFCLGDFEDDWYDDDCLLCFCDFPPKADK